MNTWRNLHILTNEEIINFLEKTMECKAPEKKAVLMYKSYMESLRLQKKCEELEVVRMNIEERYKVTESIKRANKRIKKLEKKIEVEK